jgi:hypothetical protein
MTADQYRSLRAQQDSLTADQVESRGGSRDPDLARRWAAEGGAPAAAGLRCFYAETTYRTRYRGVARFCFDRSGHAISVERHRADLPDPRP